MLFITRAVAHPFAKPAAATARWLTVRDDPATECSHACTLELHHVEQSRRPLWRHPVFFRLRPFRLHRSLILHTPGKSSFIDTLFCSADRPARRSSSRSSSGSSGRSTWRLLGCRRCVCGSRQGHSRYLILLLHELRPRHRLIETPSPPRSIRSNERAHEKKAGLRPSPSPPSGRRPSRRPSRPASPPAPPSPRSPSLPSSAPRRRCPRAPCSSRRPSC